MLEVDQSLDTYIHTLVPWRFCIGSCAEAGHHSVMLHFRLAVGLARCPGRRGHLRSYYAGLVLPASAFAHILEDEQGDIPAEYADNQLMKLSPARRGMVLEQVVKDVMLQASPGSRLEDPSPGWSVSGNRRSLLQAEWDWTMDGRKVEVKSARLYWHENTSTWRWFFQGVKLAHAGVRQVALFDDLLLGLISPQHIDILQHDMRTGVSSNGVATASLGHVICVCARGSPICWDAARIKILEKLCQGNGGCHLLGQLAVSDPRVVSAIGKFTEDSLSETAYCGIPLSPLSPVQHARSIECCIRKQISRLLEQRPHLRAEGDQRATHPLTGCVAQRELRSRVVDGF